MEFLPERKPLYTVLCKKPGYYSEFQYLDKRKDAITANDCCFFPCTILESFHQHLVITNII